MKTARLACVVLLTAVCWLYANGHEFSRYQVIIDRSPFGLVNPAGAVLPQPNFAQRYALVGVVTEAGTNEPLAVILNKESNKTEFVAAGAEFEGIKVVSIERSEDAPPRVVLQQGLERATLVYEQRAMPAVSVGIKPGTPAPGAPPPGAPRRIPFRRGD